MSTGVRRPLYPFRTIGLERGYFMRERRLIAAMIVCLAIAAGLLVSTRPMSAQNNQNGTGDREEPPPPFYNPYPPGILPPDLNSEIARVLREVDNIEGEALAQLRALPPPTLTNQPPILAHTGQRLNVLLGKAKIGRASCRERV